MTSHHNESSSNLTNVAVIASSIGLVAGIIIGVTTGKKGFNKLIEKAEELRDYVMHLGKEQLDKAGDQVEKGKKYANEAIANKVNN